jgi:hypothetical protein
MTSCPQLPTTTQFILELAGLENSSPDITRFENSIPPTAAINAVNPPAGAPFALANVTPLAFVSPPNLGHAVSKPGRQQLLLCGD